MLWSDFIYAAMKVNNAVFQLYFSNSILAVNLESPFVTSGLITTKSLTDLPVA